MKPESHLPPADYAAEHPLLADPGETRAMDHLPQLDGVRAIAVALVIWFHFAPREYHVVGGPPWGAIGVGLFFTLSGFLITRILLKCRLKVIGGAGSLWQMIRQFYVRRFLRIFPLYYGVLAILLALNTTEIRSRAGWDLAYLANVRFSYWPRPPKTEIEIERHLWSLSVEEQFYLVWPLLILITPRKLLLPLILLTVAAAPLWRYYTYVPKYSIHEWMTPACLDLLGGGALLALLSFPQFGLTRWRDAFIQLCGLIGIPMLLAYVTQRMNPFELEHGKTIVTGFDWPLLGGAVYPITSLASVWLIGTAARGFRGPIGWALTCGPVVYLGRISYGLYVIHMLVPHMLAWLMPARFGRVAQTWTVFGLYLSISIALASLSWFFFESPINRLKRYFEYDSKAAASAATSA